MTARKTQRPKKKRVTDLPARKATGVRGGTADKVEAGGENVRRVK